MEKGEENLTDFEGSDTLIGMKLTSYFFSFFFNGTRTARVGSCLG